MKPSTPVGVPFEQTCIYIVNNLPGTPVSLSTGVSPALDPDYWQSYATSAPANGQAVEAVVFSRNVGIHNEDIWVFTTSFAFDGVTVSVQEQVTGTALGSTMRQQISVTGASTGTTNWWDDGGNALQFTGASGATYTVVATLSLNAPTVYDNVTYAVALVKPGWRTIPPVMTQIQTIVMLMLENRSLDTVLGWLYNGGAPAVVYPPGSAPNFDGIQPGMSNWYSTTAEYAPTQGTDGYEQPCRTPQFDPNEPMPNVLNQLYADGSGNLPSQGPGVWEQTPTMTGFAWDYHAWYEAEPQQVMGAYSATDLPVLYGLAANFAVSDRWFSSVPTQTDPNRAFSVCGTSNGAEVNSDISDSTFASTPTVFNVLGPAGKSWRVYWQMDDPLATGEPITSWAPYTSYYFSMLNSAPNGGVYQFAQFKTDLQNGALPNFCYLEPYWGGGKGDPFDNDLWVGIQGNDYHPPAWVGPAEADLAALYTALVNSPQWPNMLLVITFDEHGGTWDHVPPPSAVPPDGNVGPSGFQFDRFGVRVPTILVSPFIPQGMVFRAPAGSQYDFDHTSFIATYLKWAGVDPTSPGLGLGARVAVAPTFEGVLSTTARTDKPVIQAPPGYAQQGGGVGASAGVPGSPPLSAKPELMDVREFRQALENSLTPEEFRVRLQALGLRKPGGRETAQAADPEKPIT
jgi:phospholipase C